jgi:hypothetical protein
MIGQYLPNNNETATVAFRQKFCQLNSLQLVLPDLLDGHLATAAAEEGQAVVGTT